MSIALTHVSYQYDSPQDDDPILDIPQWSVAAGERVFLHGPSGSGKSTLIHLLCGTLAPQKGQVQVLGQDIQQLSARQRDRFRADHIGYVFQRFNLIPYLNAIDNVRLGAQFSSARKSLTLASIEHVLTSLNINASLWQSPARALSIGQQQRIAIARALITQPQVLILDEPTSSLDQKNTYAFMELLMAQVESQGMTMIFVSHDRNLESYFSTSVALTDINKAGGR